jgi:hypothetical protein
MKFKLPKNIVSNNILKNVLYLVSLALAVSYIINEQSLALISLILIACGVYVMNKSIVIALFISIIVTNLLLSLNYLKEFNVIEGIDEKITPEEIKVMWNNIFSKMKTARTEFIKALQAIKSIEKIAQNTEPQLYKDIKLVTSAYLEPLSKEIETTLKAVESNTTLNSIQNDTFSKTKSLIKTAILASDKVWDIEDKIDKNKYSTNNKEIYSKIKEAKLLLYNVQYLAEDSYVIAKDA